MVIPGKIDFEIYQGATFIRTLEYRDGDGNPVNLTGYLGRGQIRAMATAPGVLATFIVEVTEPEEGKITVTLPASASETIPVRGRTYKDFSEYVYDIELYTDTEVLRILNGKALISPEVTR